MLPQKCSSYWKHASRVCARVFIHPYECACWLLIRMFVSHLSDEMAEVQQAQSFSLLENPDIFFYRDMIFFKTWNSWQSLAHLQSAYSVQRFNFSFSLSLTHTLSPDSAYINQHSFWLFQDIWVNRGYHQLVFFTTPHIPWSGSTRDHLQRFCSTVNQTEY